SSSASDCWASCWSAPPSRRARSTRSVRPTSVRSSRSPSSPSAAASSPPTPSPAKTAPDPTRPPTPAAICRSSPPRSCASRPEPIMPTVDERSSNQKKHESRNPVQRALINAFHGKAIEVINRARPQTVLELGCGEGFVHSALAEGGIQAELTGVELSERAARIAQERLGDRAKIEHRDARELIDDGRRFDMVMMLEVLEHIPNPGQMLPILDRLSTGW